MVEWQTRRAKDPVSARTCAFDPRHSHNKEVIVGRIFRHAATLTKEGVGQIEVYCGVIRRGRIRHAHLTSPDGRFTHCVDPDKLMDVCAAPSYWEAQRIIRDC